MKTNLIKHYILLCAFMAHSIFLMSQETYSKAYALGEYGSTFSAVAVDDIGDTYAIGTFLDTLVRSSTGLFLVKLNRYGEELWRTKYYIPSTGIYPQKFMDLVLKDSTVRLDFQPLEGLSHYNYYTLEFSMASGTLVLEQIRPFSKRPYLDLEGMRQTDLNFEGRLVATQNAVSKISLNNISSILLETEDTMIQSHSSLNDTTTRLAVDVKWSSDSTYIIAGYFKTPGDYFNPRDNPQAGLYFIEMNTEGDTLRSINLNEFNLHPENYVGLLEGFTIDEAGNLFSYASLLKPYRFGVLSRRMILHRPLCFSLDNDWNLRWSTDLNIEYWSTVFNMPIDACNSSDDAGQVVLMSHSDLDIIEYNELDTISQDTVNVEISLSLAKVNIDGEVEWFNTYLHHFEEEVYRHGDFTPSQITVRPAGGYSVVSTIGHPPIVYSKEGDTVLAHSWLLQVDNDGCLIPGCNDLNTSSDILTSSKSTILLYPNPSLGQTYIRDIDEKFDGHYKVVTVDGRQVMRFQSRDQATHILHLEHLPSGIYYLLKIDADGQLVDTKELILQI